MTATRRLDDTSAAFADIVYADPDLVRAEFEQIMSDLMPVSTCTATSPSPGNACAHVFRHPATPTANSWLRELPERVRAPPPAAAVAAADVTIPIGRHIKPSLIGRRFSHHVDVI